MEKNVNVHLSTTDFTCQLEHGEHRWTLDEPVEKGGSDHGPDPYAALLGSLGSCSAITIKMYANRKGWNIQKIDVSLNVSHRPAGDETITVFQNEIEITGDLDEAQVERLKQIVKACPISKLLEVTLKIETTVAKLSD